MIEEYLHGINGPTSLYFSGSLAFVSFTVTMGEADESAFAWSYLTDSLASGYDLHLPTGRYDCGDIGNFERFNGFKVMKGYKATFYNACFNHPDLNN
jgi:hypothetical protein